MQTIPVLVVFANPKGTDPLRLGAEDRVIREAIRRGKYRDNIELTVCHAATVHDLRQALLDSDYQVVHISGHGNGTGLVLETERGGIHVVPQKALADLLEAYCPPRGKLSCVILSACYSVSQGSEVSRSIPLTIAMEGSVGDTAAIEFSRGFYDALGAGRTFEFAYQEGRRAVALAAPDSPFVARLWERETEQAGSVPNASGDELVSNTPSAFDDSIRLRDVKALVGLAIDVSGSMSSSIRNNTGGQISRLESFRESFDRLIRDARSAVKESQERQVDTSIDFFAYGYGLRTLGVCDLFSLIKIGRQVISQDEIEEMKTRYANEMRSRYSSYQGLGSLARRYLGNVVDDAERVLRAKAEADIRHRIMTEVSRRLEAELRSAGDSTLSLEEVAQLWDGSADTITNAEDLIYGNTPMKAAFSEVVNRFERELTIRPPETLPILFVLSDGEPTDGDLLPEAQRLKSLGITIISCFVTNVDIADPRVLFGQVEPHWSKGAQLMFNIASDIELKSDIAAFLLRKGWTLHEGARLFVQLNHSEVLEEFIRVVLSPLQEPSTVALLPRGF